MKEYLIALSLILALTSPAFGQSAKEKLETLPDVAAEALSKVEVDKILAAVKKAIKAGDKADALIRARNAIMEALEEDPTLKSQFKSE